jgi:hypothetical protein
MKNQIVIAILGLFLSISSISFAQSGPNYKQQFGSKESNSSILKTVNNLAYTSSHDYKHSKGAVSFFKGSASLKKCCDKASCNNSSCCKDGSCNESCCKNNNVSSNYKQSNSGDSKTGCDVSSSCKEHKASCCN